MVYFDGVYKRGLAVLSAEILGRIIQSDGLFSFIVNRFYSSVLIIAVL